MEERRLPLAVVTNLMNISYLTGFHGSAGIALIDPEEATLLVDPRYTLQARDQAVGVEVIEEKGRLVDAAGKLARKKKPKTAGYEDSNLTCQQFDSLKMSSGPRVRWKPLGEMIEELRAVKGPEEIEAIRKACQLTCEVLEEVVPFLRPGARESDLAAEVEYRVRLKGGDRTAFDTIVASGPRAALPHAHASEKVLNRSELVIFDLGAILAAYAADMTRTFYLGEPPRLVRRIYEAVREAQAEAVEALSAGARAGDVDAAARNALARRGLAKYFTHSTGHGVGLEIHERPRLGKGEKTRLAVGSVVTAEPGVYMEGFGGVRVEDTVLIGPEGPEILTPAPKDRWVLA